MPRRGRLLVFATGMAVPLVLFMVLSLLNGSPGPADRGGGQYGPSLDIHMDGPLGYGRKVSLDEAAQLVPYRLPAPPATEATGDRTGVWIGEVAAEPGASTDEMTPQVGMVWATDLRFYVNREKVTETAALQIWNTKLATEPEVGWALTSVRGHVAFGHDGQGEDNPSSLSWMENGLSLLFVSPSHTLGQLRSLAEAITYV